MSITIQSPSYEQYTAIDSLISEVRDSPRLGLEQFYVLISGLPGFKDEGLSEKEIAGNFVRVYVDCSLTDLLAQAVSIRWKPVCLFHQFQVRRNPEMQKFTVHFRDELAMKRSIELWALNEEDAIRTVERDGYGHAYGKWLFPIEIEKAELAA